MAVGDSEDRGDVRRALPFAGSRCHRCQWVRLVAGKNSEFLACNALAMPRYAVQPVLDCEAFEPRVDGGGRGRT